MSLRFVGTADPKIPRYHGQWQSYLVTSDTIVLRVTRLLTRLVKKKVNVGEN